MSPERCGCGSAAVWPRPRAASRRTRSTTSSWPRTTRATSSIRPRRWDALTCMGFRPATRRANHWRWGREAVRGPGARPALATRMKKNGVAAAAPRARLNWPNLMARLGKRDEASEGYRLLAIGDPKFAGAALLAEGGIETARGRGREATLA